MQIKGTLLIGVLTCQAYQDRADAVRQTWGRQAEAVVYAVGRPGQPAELAGDTLYLDCPDGYRTSPKNAGLLSLRSRPARFRPRLQVRRRYVLERAGMAAMPKLHDYMGFVTVTTPPRLAVDLERESLSHGPWRGPWTSGGYGYLVSRKAVKVLADCRTRNWRKERSSRTRWWPIFCGRPESRRRPCRGLPVGPR